MNNEQTTQLDLIELFHYLKKRLLPIIACFLLGGIAGFVWTQFFTTPTYSASAKVFLMNRTYEEGVVWADIQISTYLLKDYEVLVTSQTVTQEVVNELDLDMSAGALSSKISVSAPEDSRMITITVTDTDPQRAADIANCLVDISSRQAILVLDVDAVNPVDAATVPSAPSSSSATTNAILGAAIGLILVVGVMTVIFMLDNTIRTEEDVERYLGLGTLGVIPISAEMEQDASGHYRKSKRKSHHRHTTKQEVK